jgi:hypothetical protein
MYSRITLKRPKKHDENMSIDRTDDDNEPTSLSTFSFASTPIGSSKKNGWKSRLSFIRPVSLLKNNKSNTSVY